MEANGWEFNWDDRSVFWPHERYCKDVPSTSYCGFRWPGTGVVSYKFSTSGTGTLSYGQSWHRGSVRVYMNNHELGSRSSRGTSNVDIEFWPGDTLRIKEHGDSVINIHSLCLTLDKGIHENHYRDFFIRFMNHEKQVILITHLVKISYLQVLGHKWGTFMNGFIRDIVRMGGFVVLRVKHQLRVVLRNV